MMVNIENVKMGVYTVLLVIVLAQHKIFKAIGVCSDTNSAWLISTR